MTASGDGDDRHEVGDVPTQITSATGTFETRVFVNESVAVNTSPATMKMTAPRRAGDSAANHDRGPPPPGACFVVWARVAAVISDGQAVRSSASRPVTSNAIGAAGRTISQIPVAASSGSSAVVA